MKKILSFMLIMTLMLQSFITVMAADASVNPAASEMVSFLQSLGVMNPEVDREGDEVTRENFALYLARFMNINELVPTDDRYFNDLFMDRYSTGVINTLTEMGIISQSDDKKFRPMDFISGGEALKLLLCAMGYKDYCEVRGGYPVGYLRTASQLSLSVNDEALTVEKAAELICEAAQCPLYSVTGIDEDGFKYSVNENETLFSVYRGILFDVGTVNEVKEFISVDGVQFPLKEDVVADDFLGSYAKIFYTRDNHEVLFITREGKTDDIVIDVKDFISFEDDTVKYYDSNRTRKVTVDSPSIIYNGAALRSGVDATMKNLTKGSVTLKDSNDDNSYDMIIVYDYSTFVVAAKDDNAEKLYNTLSGTGVDSIALNDYDYVRIITASGVVSDFAALEENAVISVAQSKNKEFLKLLVADNFGTGVLNRSLSDSEGYKLYIDDVCYIADKQYVANYKSTLESGLLLNKKCNYTLDAFGDIVYLEISGTDAGKLGYIVAISERGVLTKEILIKMLTSEGDIKILSLADRVDIDGIRYNDLDRGALEELVAINGSPLQLIRYDVKDEKINLIDTQKYVDGIEDEKNSLMAVFGNTNERWYSDNRLGIKAIIDSKTVVFCVPYDTSSASDEDYIVAEPSKVITNTGFYNADAYKLTKSPAIAGAMLMYYKEDDILKNYAYKQTSFLVDEIYDGLSAEGDLVKIVSGFENGTKTVYEVDPSNVELSGIEKGDLISFTFNVNGAPAKTSTNQKGYTMLYDRSVGGEPSKSVWTGITDERTLYVTGSASMENYSANFQLSFGYVRDVEGNLVEWGWKDPQIVSECVNCASIPVVIIEENDSEVEVYKGTANDIQGYEDVGSSCSKVIYHAYSNVGRALYVYK